MDTKEAEFTPPWRSSNQPRITAVARRNFLIGREAEEEG